MAPTTQKKVAQIFDPAKLFIMYGSTEAAPRLSYLDPDDLPVKWGSIGKAIPNVELFVVDQNGKQMPPYITGEIAARGSNIMVGYWNDLIETAKVLRNNLYYTGDLGIVDEDGYFYVVGRSKHVIKVGGFRVSAKEIEEALLEIDEVHEVAVIGVSDAILGEAIKAYIVLRDDVYLTQDQIRNVLRNSLPVYKQPKYIEFIDSIPKNKSGKVLRTELKQLHLSTVEK
jgi:acyl-CoA synthetase (AMP-forming)/AMP-acid ligase II